MGLPKWPPAMCSTTLDAEQNKIPKKMKHLGGFALSLHPHSISSFPCSGATRPGTR